MDAPQHEQVWRSTDQLRQGGQTVASTLAVLPKFHMETDFILPVRSRVGNAQMLCHPASLPRQPSPAPATVAFMLTPCPQKTRQARPRGREDRQRKHTGARCECRRTAQNSPAYHLSCPPPLASRCTLSLEGRYHNAVNLCVPCYRTPSRNGEGGGIR